MLPPAKIVDGPPEVVGRWSTPSAWPLVAIHAALLPTGEVLAYDRPHVPAQGSAAVLWDPAADVFTDVELGRDVFCSGHALLPDGRLLVTGGNGDGCAFQGTADVHLFDPASRTWSRETDMAVGRWYPTDLPLGDGSILIFSGLDSDCRLTPMMERYSLAGGIEVVAGGSRPLELYPRLHLLTNGEVAHVGVEPDSSIFDPEAAAWRTVATSQGGRRWAGASVHVPGDPDTVMILGGGPPARASVEQIDFAAEAPQWRTRSPMHFARMHANPVQLPDGSIVVVGGGAGNLYDEPVLRAELYDPALDTWQILPAQQYARMYHATALLLPDGRVLSAGQDHGPGARTAEIYEPPYLFRGPRPEIVTAPRSVPYGESFRVDVDLEPGTNIARVLLMTMGSVTHGVNHTQRSIVLDFVRNGDQLRIVAPDSPHRATPGYHMLFLVDDDGVPSEAAFLQMVGGRVPLLYRGGRQKR